MVRFVVESPLANNQVRSSVFHLLNHLCELFFLILSEFLVLFHAGDVKLVLGLGAGRFKWTCENGKLGVFDRGRHLWVRHVLVNQDTFYESSISETATNFTGDFDEVKWNILSFEVCDL